MIELTVYGEAKPQGSKRGFTRGGKIIMLESCKKLRPWRQEVAATAEAYMHHEKAILFKRPQPVRLEIIFIFPRPKSVKAGAYKTTMPDLDKLTRALKDALTGIVYEDDAQVVKCNSTKTFAAPGTPARTMMRISKFEGSNEQSVFDSVVTAR
jgi:crossover junction endodeoxyribonuclease RusA